MMTYQTGVRTVVVGGRPTTGPMQAASGNRGARVYSADVLDHDFELARSVNQTAKSSLPQTRDSGMYTIYAGFNLRDQLRPNDTVPLQFQYKAADCRIYYTLANIYNMSRLWRDAASAIWDDTSLCVEGSTGYVSSGNTTAAKVPPAPTAQGPGLNSAIAKHVDFNIEATGGLPDGEEPPSRNLKIQRCTTSLTCVDRVSQCEFISIPCSSGPPQEISACLPPCQNRDRSSSCRGANTYCDLRFIQESKLSVTGVSSTNINPEFGPLRRGLCVPIYGTPELGCPV